MLFQILCYFFSLFLLHSCVHHFYSIRSSSVSGTWSFAQLRYPINSVKSQQIFSFFFFNFFMWTLCAAHSTTLSIDEKKKTQQKLGQKDERFATCFVSETKTFYVVDILPNNRSCKLYFLALINWMSKVKWYIIESSFVKFVLAYSTILLLLPLLTLIQFRFIKKHFFEHSKKREKKWTQTTNKWNVREWEKNESVLAVVKILILVPDTIIFLPFRFA